MSALTIVQNALVRLGLPSPPQAVGSSDSNATSMLSLAQQEGKELARAYPWQALSKEKTFTTVAQEVQTDAIPGDFDRFVPETFYNRSKRRFVIGPLTAQEWADQKGRLATTVYDSYRVRGSNILLLPTPAAGETFAYEYVSLNWVTDSSGATERASFEADEDVSRLDEEVITLGSMWRFLRARGLDYAEAFRSYELQKKALLSRDGGATRISMDGGDILRRPLPPITPDGDWPLV